MIRRCTTCNTMISSYSRTGRCLRHRLSPEQIDQIRERNQVVRPWELLTPERRADPVMRARIGKGVSEARMAWCPRYLRAEYLAMAAKKIPAADRRRIIMEQHKRNVAKGVAE